MQDTAPKCSILHVLTAPVNDDTNRKAVALTGRLGRISP